MEEAETGSEGEGVSGNILLIEDEDIVRSSTQMMLEDAGYGLFVAASGEEGMEIFKARQGEIDVVLLDMVMPGMTGGEVFDLLREIDPKVRVVMTSGMRRINDVPAEVKGFVGKPFTQREVVAAIEKAMK